MQFVGLEDEDRASETAAAFALLVAGRVSRTAWLVDLDLRRNPCFWAFARGQFGETHKPGGAYDAGFGAERIYTLQADSDAFSKRSLLTGHRVGTSRLLVTRFLNDELLPGDRLRLQKGAGWWAALKAATDWVIVTAPPVEKTRAGLIAVSQADAVVICAHADHSSREDVSRLAREVTHAGGHVAGVVMTQTGADARFLDRLIG